MSVTSVSLFLEIYVPHRGYGAMRTRVFCLVTQRCIDRMTFNALLGTLNVVTGIITNVHE